MDGGELRDADGCAMAPVQVFNRAGAGPVVLAADHASNRIPQRYWTLGLAPHQRLMHIAWDPGALAVALRLSEALDAPLVASTVSRLMVDCNRAPDAADLIPTLSERTEIPGNSAVSEEERRRRIARYHAPYHAALEEVLEVRRQAGQPTALVTIHSFTPVYRDVARPWPIGLIPGADEGLARRLAAALMAQGIGPVGWNEPYAGRLGVTYTLEHHGDDRALPCVMIELRQDGVLETDDIARWAAVLAEGLRGVV